MSTNTLSLSYELTLGKPFRKHQQPRRSDLDFLRKFDVMGGEEQDSHSSFLVGLNQIHPKMKDRGMRSLSKSIGFGRDIEV